MEITKKKIVPVIFGLSGYYLKNEEIKIIKQNKIFGYIFFKRNIINFSQFKNLINHIKSISIDKPLMMIDHEGGRVNRFSNFFSQKKYTGSYFGNLYKFNKKKFYEEVKFFVKFNVNVLKNFGIDTIAYPVVDLSYNKTHNVIGDRSFSDKVEIVNNLSKLFVAEYQKRGINCVSKHAPGHGLATKDSHYSLPIVNESYEHLLKYDLKCFKNLRSKFIMTAHIKYNSLDKILATFSKKIINLIRKETKFKGMIMTDDICMKALKENLYFRVTQPLIAGCDIILHCNGNINEMKKIISILNIWMNQKIK